MQERDWDHQFERIVESIDMEDMVTDPREGISLWQINRGVLAMTEASMYLSRFIGQFLQYEDMKFPESIGLKLGEIVKLAGEIADALVECECPECTQCEDCTEDEMCEACVILEDLEEEDES